MKNLFKSFVVIAIVAVIGFSFSTCKEDDGGDDNTTVGTTVNLVVPITIPTGCTETDFGYNLKNEGNGYSVQSLGDIMNGTPEVKITNGKLTIKLDVPKEDKMNLFKTFFYGDVYTVEPSDTKFWFVLNFCDLSKNFKLTLSGSAFRWTYLLYVDKTVTVNGNETNEGHTFIHDNVTLQQGWNYLIYKKGDDANTTVITASRTLPAGLNWILEANNP